MSRLTTAQKTYVVTELASFASLSEVQRGLKERFGLEDVPLSQISCYDPERSAGASLSKPLRELFRTTREACVNELTKVPSMYRAYRVRRLHEMAQTAERRGNLPLAAAILKQIAEEIGGKYVNTISLSLSVEDWNALASLTTDEILKASASFAIPGEAQYDGRVHGAGGLLERGARRGR